MHVSARVDYAMRALLVLATEVPPSDLVDPTGASGRGLRLAAEDGRAPVVGARGVAGAPRLITRDELAAAQAIPPPFLEAILGELRKAGIVSSRRGSAGGFRLARPADAITVADVVRALDGPLAAVRGERPEDSTYTGPAEHLQDVWVATRAALRSVLDEVTLADIVAGQLPEHTRTLLSAPDAWEPR